MKYDDNIDGVEQLSKDNPKSHDSLFKWLITSFFDEFTEHYFPEIRVVKYTFIDKEFISKYEALKESLRGDIFIAAEVETDSGLCEMVIHLEHESKKQDMSVRVFEYLCYAWMLKKKPVWSIVIYTDDAVWRKPVSDSFLYGFNSRNKEQYHNFDIIKVNKEKSGDLIKKHSLMCKLLALKAKQEGADPEELIYEIFKAVAKMEKELSDDIKLLIWQWVDFYKKVSKERVEIIKEEVSMGYMAQTITEHYEYQGMIKGKIKGKIEGKIENLESLYKQGILTGKQYNEMSVPLKKELSMMAI